MEQNQQTQNEYKKPEKVSVRYFDYKDVETLNKYLSPHGRILSRRRTNLTAHSQRVLGTAVKRARFMGLIPYVVE
jgi:small subunit ribosomal protein S18